MKLINLLGHSIYSRGKNSEILQYFKFSNFTLSSKPIMKISLVSFLFKKQTNIYHMLLTILYSESAYPITPVEPLKATLYDHFGISVYFVYFIQ